LSGSADGSSVLLAFVYYLRHHRSMPFLKLKNQGTMYAQISLFESSNTADHTRNISIEWVRSH
jgi:hypothetical protein